MVKSNKVVTCNDCVNYQKTLLKYDDGSPVYDCPFAHDWCESNTPINTLCDNDYESRKETMQDWEEYSVQNERITTGSIQWEKVDVRCPKCGEPIYKNTTEILTSYPPQYQYKCFKCGWWGTAYH